MTRIRRLILVLTVVLLVCVWPVQAQFTVFDPTNYAEAIAQLEQMVQQYEFMLRQAVRVPVDLATRYHAYSLDWTTHLASGLAIARSLLDALNLGDAGGDAYRRAVEPLDDVSDVADRMPPDLRRRLETSYATIELADSINRLAIDQTGLARASGPLTLQAVRNVEHDIVNALDAFHSQTALLEKINAAEAIALRLEEQTNQFQLSTLEQQFIETKRKRDTEAALVNATIHQWRYGQAYGQDLFRHTATDLDGWRPY